MATNRIIILDDGDYGAMPTRAVLHRRGCRSDRLSGPSTAPEALADRRRAA